MQNRIDRLSAQSFDWVLLRSFLAIYRAGSVAGAARAMAQQQPTLSRHLMELERQLGKPLFERAGRGLVATETAHLVAVHATQMEQSANRLSLALTAQATELSGTVRITASQMTATQLLPPIISELLHQQPGLEIEMVVSDSIQNLLEREADIAVRMVRPQQLELVTRKIGDVAVVAAAHANYLAQHGTPQSLADLLQHRMLGYDKNDTILAGFARDGMALDKHHFRFRCDDQLMYLLLLQAGAGIGFIPAYVLQQDPMLRQVLPDMPLPALPCWLTVHKEIASNALVRRVFDGLAQALGARLQPGEQQK